MKKITKWTAKDEGLFVKLYFKQLKVFFGLSGAAMKTIQYMAVKMSVKSNIYHMTAYNKRQMIEDTGLKQSTVEHALIELKKAGLLIWVERGVYRINPKYMAKANWDRVMAMRWSVIKNYDKNNYKIELYESIDEDVISTEELNEILE